MAINTAKNIKEMLPRAVAEVRAQFRVWLDKAPEDRGRFSLSFKHFVEAEDENNPLNLYGFLAYNVNKEELVHTIEQNLEEALPLLVCCILMNIDELVTPFKTLFQPQIRADLKEQIKKMFIITDVEFQVFKETCLSLPNTGDLDTFLNQTDAFLKSLNKNVVPDGPSWRQKLSKWCIAHPGYTFLISVTLGAGIGFGSGFGICAIFSATPVIEIMVTAIATLVGFFSGFAVGYRCSFAEESKRQPYQYTTDVPKSYRDVGSTAAYMRWCTAVRAERSLSLSSAARETRRRAANEDNVSGHSTVELGRKP